MAADDNKSNVGAADAEGEATSAEPREPQVPKPPVPPKSFAPLAGPSLPVVFGRSLGGGAVISSVMVDGKEFWARENPQVNLNSKIEVFGKNLDAFDEWQIQQAGRNPINLDAPVRGGGFKVIFTISKRLADRLFEGANFGITFFGSKVGGRRRILPMVFVFQAKAAEEAGQKPKTGTEEGGAPAGAGAPLVAGGAGGLDMAKMMTQAGGEAMGGAVGGLVTGLKGGRQAPQAQQPKQTVEEIAASGKFVGARRTDIDTDIEGQESIEGIAGGEVETSAQVQVRTAPETVRQSAELVGEYIDKHPGIIAHTQTRERVLGALQSGNLSNLSAEEYASLQTAVKAISSSPSGTANAQVQSAAKMVGQASVQAQASIQEETGVKAGVGVSGMVSAEAGAQGQVSTSAAAEGGVWGQAKMGGGVTAGASMNLKQSAELVGEYLDKNPQTIPDTAARNRILQAFRSGNLDRLPEADKKLLINVLQPATAAPNQPAQMQAAMQTVMNVAAGKTQPFDSAQGKPVESLKEGPAALERPAGISREPSRIEEEPAGVPSVQPPLSPVLPTKEEGEAEEPKVAVPPEVQKEIDALKAREKPLGGGLPTKPSPEGPVSSAAPGAAVPGAAKVPGALGKEAPTGAEAGEGEAPAIKQAGLPSPPSAQEPIGPQGGGEPAKPGEAQPQEAPPAGEPSEPPSRPMEKPSPDQKPQPTGEGEEEQPPKGEEGQPREPEAGRRQKTAASAAAESLALKEAETVANKALNAALLEGAAWVWAAAIPSFGLSILLGAIAGDLIWLFKGLILNRIASNSPILKKFKEQSFQIKLSGAVKGNILAMNLVAIALIFLLIVVVFAVIWGICNSWITYPVRKSSDFDQLCKVIEQGTIGQALNSARSSGTFTASYNTPGELMGTAKWSQAINTYAQKWNIDACVLKVVVQKESGGRELAIGCDCAANGKPNLCTPFDASMPPTYNLNWDQCSHGIGLTQWTIYPRGSTESYKLWLNSEVPTRNIFGQWYSATDLLLKPELSLDLTAQAFSQNLGKAGGDVRAAFAAYVGQSSRTNQLVDDRMALYNLCAAQK